MTCKMMNLVVCYANEKDRYSFPSRVEKMKKKAKKLKEAYYAAARRTAPRGRSCAAAKDARSVGRERLEHLRFLLQLQ